MDYTYDITQNITFQQKNFFRYDFPKPGTGALDYLVVENVRDRLSVSKLDT